MKNILLLCLLVSFHTLIAQQHSMNSYRGQWEGEFDNAQPLNFTINLEKISDHVYNFTINAHHIRYTQRIESSTSTPDKYSIGNEQYLLLDTENPNQLRGFISSGIYFYQLSFTQIDETHFQSRWDLFQVRRLLNKKVFLSIENVSASSFDAYPFFGERRFPGTWCFGAKQRASTINFQDFRTGLQFEADLKEKAILLKFKLFDTVFTSVLLRRSTTDWDLSDSKLTDKNENLPNPIHHPSLREMEQKIIAGSYPKIHSILLMKEGKIGYEHYFSGFNATALHDQRSASKSISSTLIGIALDRKELASVNQPLAYYLPTSYQQNLNVQQKQITLKHLLTMSSGMDAIDFGTSTPSKASEQVYQNTPNWTQTILDAPMRSAPGTKANYGTANPYLLKYPLEHNNKLPLPLFIDRYLFAPLKINQYAIQKDRDGKVYLGGGMLLSSQHMLRFGQLVLQNGQFNQEQVVSKKWIQEATQASVRLENTVSKNAYGYLWWIQKYRHADKSITTIEARGNGGQYIIIIPKLKAVCVITAGNYNSSQTKLPETLFQKYLLPALLE
ncbi:conserved exported hypothetical protein [Tenacibaculum litopenaei]|uniref:serine hydrolase domain-containing protein n=1 Tax=Tenacibaculum litopenaei TaxID=396016 RepID=UPI00389648EF